MFKLFVLVFLLIFLISCQQEQPLLNISEIEKNLINNLQTEKEKVSFINKEGADVFNRIKTPAGFDRLIVENNSFSEYLRYLPLKPDQSKVSYYDGRIKNPGGVYLAVVDFDLGKQNLQQCADAVIRLRAEYLYKQKKHQDIHFNFVSDGQPRYFKDYADNDYSYASFKKYLDYIFTYANTASLFDELEKVEIENMQIGDIFIEKRNPYGHAVMVVDMGVNKETKEKIFLLAQSYMPAQDIQILQNPNNEQLNPWYSLDFGQKLITPEWIFTKENLRRFKN